eukprot:6464225-Amphidinium_carterae.1
MNLDGTQSMQELYSGQDKDGYTVDAVTTTAWMDIVETDYQRKLRVCENNADGYHGLVKHSPQWTEPLGEIKTIYDEEGSLSVNVTNALQDQEVPDFFATPVMKPLTLEAHQIFQDRNHYDGWVEATKAELASFDALGVKEDVWERGQPDIIPSQLVATVKPSNAVATLGPASRKETGDEVQGGEVLFSPGTEETTPSTAKDGQGESQFVLEYPVFPPSAAQKGKNSAKNAKNKQAK